MSEVAVVETTGSPAVEARPDGPDPVVSVRGLTKHFQRSDGAVVRAVDSVDLDIAPGECVVLLGPSGCGKTTLLRCIAGLEKPDTGNVSIHGRPMFSSDNRVDVAPDRRDLSMVFQSYALWPHMTVFDNVAYPLRCRRVSKSETAERVSRALQLVSIPELGRQHPGQLSGGQQQRVALARAIVGEGALILFDEPLSNVDAKVREQLRAELVGLQHKLGFAAVYVTHDQTEAMGLANRIAVMEHGKVGQVGTPREIYEQPLTRYVANFVGSSNELAGTVVERRADSTARVNTELGPIVGVLGDESVRGGDEVVALWRPERSVVTVEEPHSPNRWQGRMDNVTFLGSTVEFEVAVGDQVVKVVSSDAPDAGAELLWMGVDPERVQIVRR